ncbi:MAG: glycosyltransferase family 1 protein, partial [Bacteroidota bacterium]
HQVDIQIRMLLIEPRKNLLNTAKAFLRLIEEHPDLDVHLVICGKKGWKFEELFKEDLTQSKRIHFTGFVNDEDLPLLYAHALALCYVSYYEGFGLPPLEAMSCGTPVIFGDNSSMPEVVGKGGLPAVADDVEAIKSQMHRLVADPVFREELAREAWRQSRRFSWLKTTLQTLEAYRKVIER